MLKKVTSFLSKLNTFCIISFFLCFFVIRLDARLNFMPDNFFTVWLWTGFVSAGGALLFIISVLLLTFKEKKPQTDFGFVVTYFLDSVFVSIVGYFVYEILTYGIFWH